MCGLSGIIFGKKVRTKKDYHDLKEIFTSMFIFSEARGHHASGVAMVNTDGKSKLYKLPVPPTRMATFEGYNKILDSLSNKTTILLGHSRWKTVGTEYNNNNNQPVVAGSIIGTHNGTIHNASSLFKKYQFKRTAEVDSEILFRMAEASLNDGIVNTNTYRNYISQCQGDLSCVYVSKTDPNSVYLYKGNRPLNLYYNARLQVILYSSCSSYIEDSLDNIEGWVPLRMPENRMYQTRFDDFGSIVSDTFTFQSYSSLMGLIKSTPQRSLFK